MQTVTETPQAKANIRHLRLWERYTKQKDNFIKHPNLKSLDIVIWDRKNKIMSFKITNKYRVKYIKNVNGSYTVFDAGNFH